jgi:hypothetical protein
VGLLGLVAPTVAPIPSAGGTPKPASASRCQRKKSLFLLSSVLLHLHHSRSIPVPLPLFLLLSHLVFQHHSTPVFQTHLSLDVLSRCRQRLFSVGASSHTFRQRSFASPQHSIHIPRTYCNSRVQPVRPFSPPNNRLFLHLLSLSISISLIFHHAQTSCPLRRLAVRFRRLRRSFR